MIGQKGEIFAFSQEKNRLKNLNLLSSKYPQYVAAISDSCGFDILSLNERFEEIYIEVKTTTRLLEDPEACKFYLSAREERFYRDNNEKFFLYRVYDIEGEPILIVIDMKSVELEIELYAGYINK